MKPNPYKLFCAVLLALGTAGCSWLFPDPADDVNMVPALSDPAQCRFIAQAIGTAKTYITTSDPEEIREQRLEAADDIKRIAVRRGGDTVVVAETSTFNNSDLLDNTESRIIGRVYRCR